MGALLSRQPEWFEAHFLGDDPGISMFIFAQVWLILLLFMILSHITVRCARLNLVLPLPTRKVWLARITSILAAGLLPLAVFTLVLSLHPWIFNGGFGSDTNVLRLGIMVGLGLTFTALVYQSPSPDLFSVRVGWFYVLFVAVVSCAVPTAILLAPRSFVLAAVMAGASLLLGVRIYFSLPLVLSLAPRRIPKAGERERPGSRAVSKSMTSDAAWPNPVSTAFRGNRGFGRLLHMTVFRVLASHPLAWIVFPVAAFYGYGLARAYYLGANLQPYFLVTLAWLLALLFQGVIRMHKLDPFPISRRLLFAYSILPIVVVMAVGAGAGQLHFMLKQHQCTDSDFGRYEEPREPAKRGEPAVVWPENRGSKLRSRTMATRVLVFGLITTAVVCLGLQQFRATTPEAVYPWLLQGLAVPLVVVVGGVYLADKLGYADFHAVAAFPEVLLKKLGESLPLSTPAIWGLAIATLGIGYRVIQSRFRKIEAPLQHKKKLSEY